MIGLADKLSNMRDIDRDYPVVGEELWNRFRMKDKKMIGWYYKGIRMRFGKRFPRFRLMKSTVTWWTGISEVGNHRGEQGTGAHFPLGMCIHFYSPECHLFESGSQDNAFAYTRDCDTPPDTV